MDLGWPWPWLWLLGLARHINLHLVQYSTYKPTTVSHLLVPPANPDNEPAHLANHTLVLGQDLSQKPMYNSHPVCHSVTSSRTQCIRVPACLRGPRLFLRRFGVQKTQNTLNLPGLRFGWLSWARASTEPQEARALRAAENLSCLSPLMPARVGAHTSLLARVPRQPSRLRAAKNDKDTRPATCLGQPVQKAHCLLSQNPIVSSGTRFPHPEP